MRRHRLLALLLAAVLPAACVPPAQIDRSPEHFPALVGCAAGACSDTVHLTYLGVSGFLIRRGETVVLTAPSYSNPPLLDVLLPWRRIRSDTAFIDRHLPAEAARTSAILVGHGHYDHLLDVPYIARTKAREARIYGSRTVYHLLMGDSALRADRRVDSVSLSAAATRDRMGRWWYPPHADSAVRFMALESRHAPQLRALSGLLRVTFARGRLKRDLPALPSTSRGWKMGEPLAYVIDLLGEDRRTPVFRIHFQDAASPPPFGFPPRFAPADERLVDLALVCVGNAQNAGSYPDSLLAAMRPRFVVLGHWERFFQKQDRQFSFVEFTDADRLIARLSNSTLPGAGWLMPRPGTTLRLCVCR